MTGAAPHSDSLLDTAFDRLAARPGRLSAALNGLKGELVAAEAPRIRHLISELEYELALLRIDTASVKARILRGRLPAPPPTDGPGAGSYTVDGTTTFGARPRG
jgi:hypothetical protein